MVRRLARSVIVTSRGGTKMHNTYGLGKLAWRVIWVTIGFYAVAIVALSIQGSDLAGLSLYARTHNNSSGILADFLIDI